MDPIAKTAYYCCGVRAADAASPTPVCGDQFAQRFMTPAGREIFKNFERFRLPNATNATRARIIDDWLRERLNAVPDLRVVLVGAGFDTRAYRLDGGHWVELDQPSLIAAKNAALPIAEARNPLQRVAIDFSSESLADRLKPWATAQPTVVVMEGVSMYLTVEQLQATLAALRQAFPQHTLICDLMTAYFVRRFGGAIQAEIAKLGGRFAPPVADPAGAVAAMGYNQIRRVSMVARARELGAIRIPGLLLNTFLRGLRDGYCAYQFEAKT